MKKSKITLIVVLLSIFPVLLSIHPEIKSQILNLFNKDKNKDNITNNFLGIFKSETDSKDNVVLKKARNIHRSSPIPSSTTSGAQNSSYDERKEHGIEVYFSPHEDCAGIICHTIGKAKHTIHIQAYSFTCRKIWSALMEKLNNGVKIYIILDSSQEKSPHSLYNTVLYETEIPLYIDTPASNKIAHNKIILIDIDTENPILITGSYNFSRSAQKNSENILIIDGSVYKNTVKAYMENWERRKSLSKNARRK